MKRSRRQKTLMPHKAFTGREGGFTLIEVLLAVFLLMFGLLAVASMQVSAITGNAHANRITEATGLLQDRIEILLGGSYADLTSGSETVGRHTLTWTVTENTSGQLRDTKVVKIKISGGGLKKDIEFTSVRPKGNEA